jgi:hypothetical protein
VPVTPALNDDAVDQVANSIRTFGWRQPIVVDQDEVIIVGHTRLKAAIKLGLSEVPVHVARDLTPDQVRAYRLADNKLAELAEWNMELLPIELGQLKAADFDLGLIGFSDEELAKYLGGEVTEGRCDPDDVRAPPDEAVTQLGDLWILGNHRLLCGDSSKPEDLDRLLNGQPIHLCNTDPPYNVKVEPRSNNAIAAGLSSFQGPKHHQSMDVSRHPEKSKPTQKNLRAKDRPLANDFVSDEEFDRLLDARFGNIVPRPGAAISGSNERQSSRLVFERSHSVIMSKRFLMIVARVAVRRSCSKVATRRADVLAELTQPLSPLRDGQFKSHRLCGRPLR